MVQWSIADGLVRLLSDAQATFEEWKAALEEARRDPSYRRGMGVFHDWRALKVEWRVVDEIKTRGAYLEEQAASFGPTRWAVVVSTDVNYAYGRMGEAFTSSPQGLEVQVFRDPLRAEAWARGED